MSVNKVNHHVVIVKKIAPTNHQYPRIWQEIIKDEDV
jgi:hypothetical protein